jgi:hypothetical protein
MNSRDSVPIFRTSRLRFSTVVSHRKPIKISWRTSILTLLLGHLARFWAWPEIRIWASKVWGTSFLMSVTKKLESLGMVFFRKWQNLCWTILSLTLVNSAKLIDYCKASRENAKCTPWVKYLFLGLMNLLHLPYLFFDGRSIYGNSRYKGYRFALWILPKVFW